MVIPSISFRSLGLSCLLCFGLGLGLFLNASAAAQQPVPRSSASLKLEAETKKNKESILKIGLSKDVTIHRRSGVDLVGMITEIKDESVVVRDADLRANAEIRYEQIKNVEKGYSDSRSINGQRIPPKKHRIGLLIMGGLAVGVAVFLISVLRDPNF